jgi:hypothetical protein
VQKYFFFIFEENIKDANKKYKVVYIGITGSFQTETG